MIGKGKKKTENRAPDSQTSQATCQTREIDRAHRSHSTREAKQNKTNKKNQGSPIKTIKSHDSILVPILGRGVFTAGFAPARPFPTPTYKCVGGSRSRKSRLDTNALIVLHSLGIFFFFFLSKKNINNIVSRDRTHVPTC